MLFRFSSLFRPAPRTHETAVAMVDPRPGNELLVIGTEDPKLAASCAAAVGLNGRAVVIGRGNEERLRIERAAEEAGALVEFVDAPPGMLPFDPDTFGLVVIPKLPQQRTGHINSALGEAMRVLKPGGRVIAIAGQKRGGVFGALQSAEPKLSVDEVLTLLKSTGAVASRKLAEVEGVAYYEARKPRQP